jgi:hypothetical protein
MNLYTGNVIELISHACILRVFVKHQLSKQGSS